MSVCVHVCAPLDICVYVPMVSGVYLKILTCFMQCFNNGLKRNSRNITTLISDCVTVYSWLRYSQIWGVATWRARVSLHRLVSIKREKEGSKTLVNKMLTQSSSFFPLVLFSCDENALQVFFFLICIDYRGSIDVSPFKVSLEISMRTPFSPSCSVHSYISL